MILRALFALLVFDYASGGLVFLLKTLGIGRGDVVFALGAVFVFLLLVRRRLDGDGPLILRAPPFTFVMLIVWVLVVVTSAMITGWNATAWQTTQTLIHGLFILAIVTTLIPRRELLDLVPFVVVLSVLFQGLLSLAAYFGVFNLAAKMAVRAYGFTINPNASSMNMAACLLYLPFVKQRWLRRGAVGAASLTIVLSSSRSGLVLLTLALLMLLVFVYKRRRAAVGIGVAAPLAIYLVPTVSFILQDLFPSRYWQWILLRERLGFFYQGPTTGSGGAEKILERRIDAQWSGMRNAWRGLIKNPLLGTGFDGYYTGSQVLRKGLFTAHNGFLHFFAQTGFLSFFFYLVFLWQVVRDVGRSTYERWRVVHKSAVVIYLAANMVTPELLLAKYFMFFFALGTVAMPDVAATTHSTPAPPTETKPRMSQRVSEGAAT